MEIKRTFLFSNVYSVCPQTYVKLKRNATHAGTLTDKFTRRKLVTPLHIHITELDNLHIFRKLI